MRAQRGRLALLAIGAVASLALGRYHARLRHLALPTLEAAPPPPTATAALGDEPPCSTHALAQLPARVTALLRASDGALFLGTFDHGLYRLPPGGAAPTALDTRGRERFVNALVEWRGQVVAGTARGALAFSLEGNGDGGGARLAARLPDEAVEALLPVGAQLLAGTPHGLYDVEGERSLNVHGPSGEAIRVTALALSDGQLFLGSAEGLYSLPASLSERRARWQPLVFGEPAAATNVVTSLAAIPGGVLAGTDDGGLVRVDERGPAALRFADRRANELNPGAAFGDGRSLWFGSEGAGLLHARRDGSSFSVARPAALPARISSLAASGDVTLLLGTSDGEVLGATCPADHS